MSLGAVWWAITTGWKATIRHWGSGRCGPIHYRRPKIRDDRSVYTGFMEGEQRFFRGAQKLDVYSD